MREAVWSGRLETPDAVLPVSTTQLGERKLWKEFLRASMVHKKVSHHKSSGQSWGEATRGSSMANVGVSQGVSL